MCEIVITCAVLQGSVVMWLRVLCYRKLWYDYMCCLMITCAVLQGRVVMWLRVLCYGRCYYRITCAVLHRVVIWLGVLCHRELECDYLCCVTWSCILITCAVLRYREVLDRRHPCGEGDVLTTGTKIGITYGAVCIPMMICVLLVFLGPCFRGRGFGGKMHKMHHSSYNTRSRHDYDDAQWTPVGSLEAATDDTILWPCGGHTLTQHDNIALQSQ